MDAVALYRDDAVVLRVYKLGEADRIITLLTRRHGRVRAVAKGVRRTKSRFGGRLEPFSHIDVQLSEGRSLDIITQVESRDTFGPAIAADYAAYTAATAMVETAERLTSEERQPALRQYLLLVSALRAVATAERSPSLALDSYLLRAMHIAGWAPALTECAKCSTPGPHPAFHIAAGGSVCHDCRPPGAIRPHRDSLTLLAALASGRWDVADAAELPIRRESSGMVAALVQYHLERALRSLPMVDRDASCDAGVGVPVVAAAVGAV